MSIRPDPDATARAPGRLRILHVDAASHWRGAERQLLLLARAQRAAGHEPLVAGRPNTPLLQRLKTDGIATAALAMRGTVDLLAVRRLRRLIATWRPDVVHAHDTRGHATALAALVGRGRAVPLVVTRRSTARPRGLVNYGLRVARVIAISRAVADALRHARVGSERVAVVYPGVSIARPERPRDWRRECGWPSDALVVGVVGPIAEPRHGDRLARLAAGLAEASPGRAGERAPIGVVVLGGPAAGRGDIGGLPAIRAGFVHELPEALAGLDLLIHPGGHDGLGTALVEAMALGVACVAFDEGGPGEVIVQDESGLLAPARDDAALVRCAAELAADPDRRRGIAARGPGRARDFSPERMAAGVEAVYRDVLPVTGGARRP